MIWLFLDGTSVELGGVVRGTSDLARVLRRDAEAVALGEPPAVVRLAPGVEDLALDDPELLDSWVRNRARLLGVELAAAPDFPRTVRRERFDPNVEY